jgi:hypothetical protein
VLHVELELRPKMVAQIAKNLDATKRKLTLSQARGGLQPEPTFLDNGRRQLTSDSIAAVRTLAFTLFLRSFFRSVTKIHRQSVWWPWPEYYTAVVAYHRKMGALRR